MKTPSNFVKLQILTISLIWHGIHSYSISYTDCSKPNIIKKYDLDTVCDQPADPLDSRQEFTLVQRQQVQELTGWSCSMVVARLYAKCGAWSHIKLAAQPQMERNEKVSPELCNQMINNRKFRPYLSTTDYPIQIDSVNIIAVAEIGSLTEEQDSVRCVGETVHISNAIHTNVVQLASYKIIIQKEAMMAKGEEIEVSSKHVKLPCSFSRKGCATATATYIWEDTKPACPLEKIKTIKASHVMDSFLYDPDNKILINTTGMSKVPGCVDINLQMTGYHGLYISSSEQAKLLPLVTDRDIDIIKDYKMADDYLEYEVERRMSASATAQLTLLCKQQMTNKKESPTPLEDGKYGLIKGSLLYVFYCRNSTGKIIELEVCHEDVPIESNPQQFVDTSTGLLKTHSPRTGCDKRFPLTVKTHTGWVTVNPHIQPTAAPEKGKPVVPVQITHMDMHASGLYTQEQRDAWEALITFPQYHQAILKSVSWGSCRNAGDCSKDTEAMESMTGYDLSRLIPDVSQLDIWGQFKHWVESNGAWLALLVIIITMVKLLINITILSITLIQEGPAALLALITLLCCQGRQTYRKVKKRNQRLADEEAMEMDPNQKLVDDGSTQPARKQGRK